MKVLLHACCGPCIIGLLDFFQDHDLTLFFYNPNIEPKEEYQKRLESVKKIAQEFNLKLIEDDYENGLWHSVVDHYQDEPEGGERCKICFKIRLENLGLTAKSNGFDAMATSLSVNVWKDTQFINQTGQEIAERLGLKFFNFNLDQEQIKKICYQEKELSKQHNLYIQKYCGCLYGLQNQK
ncbi:MAG: epoxyqueuosine reductase QueH [Nanoarchaeota archaeon]|nr:epoxyqueuosine reductase QueH [Nanoarchaeota archaeon]